MATSARRTPKNRPHSDEPTRRMAANEDVALPYATDLAYIDEELQWMQARGGRIVAERRLNGRSDARMGRHNGREESDSPRVLERRVRTLGEQERRVRRNIDHRLRAHRATDKELALDTICRVHELDDLERTIILLAAAPCFSRRFGELYEALNDAGYGNDLSIEAIFNFAELGFTDRIDRRSTFAPDGRLVSNDLVAVEFSGRYNSPKDLLGTDVNITTRTFAAILGDERLPHEFMEFSSLEVPLARLEHVVLDDADKRRILSVVDRHSEWLQCRKDWGFDDRIAYGRGALMLFFGKPGTGKTMTAHAVAHHLGKRVLNVDIPTFLQNNDAQQFLPSLFREARQQNAVLFFDECETIFGDRRHGNTLMTMLLTEIERFEGVAILATNLPEVLDAALDRRLMVKVRFPEPDRAARSEIWAHHLPSQAPIADDVDVDQLAARYELTGGYIKNAVLMAVAAAVHRSDDVADATIGMADLEQAARDQLLRPGDEDNELVHPEVRLSDVVLNARLAEQVQEVIGAARNRRTVLDRWGIGKHLCRGKGIVALMSGPPGTGKTLTAEAIASELGRPLMPACTSSVLSKWVGETERKLERLFDTCRQHNAVLFLDECDGLLGKRNGDRDGAHSVSMVNTLLRLIERHEGVILLASNRPDALDPAAMRRLSHHLRFALPDTQGRAQIWRGLLPEGVPTDERLDLGALARHFPLSGAAIQNAVFRAAFRAAHVGRGVTMQDLQEAAAEESPADLTPEMGSMGGAEA